MNASTSAANATPQTAAHATIRHLRDGSYASANSSIKNTPARVSPAGVTHDENQATYSPPGNAKFYTSA